MKSNNSQKRASSENTPKNTPKRHENLRAPWEPGESGNPAGRPRGSRNKFNEAFLADFIDAWQRTGREALTRVAAETPGVFVRVAASLLPRHFKMEHGFEDMTDEQLEKYIDRLNEAIAAELRTSARADERDTRASSSDTKH